jgi:hypothetical protein
VDDPQSFFVQVEGPGFDDLIFLDIIICQRRVNGEQRVSAGGGKTEVPSVPSLFAKSVLLGNRRRQ